MKSQTIEMRGGKWEVRNSNLKMQISPPEADHPLGENLKITIQNAKLSPLTSHLQPLTFSLTA